MTSTVSVALCTHNGSRYIAEQIRSILAQSQPVFEVVISDDASTDGTVEIIEREWELFGDQSPTLKILRNDVALGVSLNFQQAITATVGDLISLCDQDDVWAPTKVEVLAREFEARPSLGLLFTNARLVDRDGQQLSGTLFDALEISAVELADVRRGCAASILFRRNLVTGATAMFRRGLIDKIMPLDAEWVHDEWIAVIASVISDIDWLPDLLIDYRQHGANQIGVSTPTFSYKIGRVFRPRLDRYSGLLTRTEHLRERLRYLGAPPEVMKSIDEKLVHQRRRAELPALRIARIPPVIREAATGRYSRFSSQGRFDILRDLLSPQR